MTKSELVRLIGSSENYDISVGRMQSARARLRRGRRNGALSSAIDEYLRANDFVIDGGSLCAFLAGKPEIAALGYRTLFSLADHIACAVYDALPALDPSQRENALNSLRTADLINSERMVAQISDTEKRLLVADGGIYARCDTATKAQVRRRVAHIAARKSISEYEAAGMPGITDTPAKKKLPMTAYFICMFLIFAALMTVFSHFGGFGVWLALLSVLPLSQAAKELTDRLFSRIVRDAPPARLALTSVPDGAQTLVVITCLLTGERRDAARFDSLEEFYLSNRHDGLIFGILGDFGDSAGVGSSADEGIVKYARARIDALNRKYGERFALFIRGRVYSKSEGCFIAWERKRGAVCELVRLIKRHPNSFETILCDRLALHRTKYIVTLDSDTRLYPGAVLDMLGAMLHPSNKPVVDRGRVVSGYGVMQPRMDTTLESAGKTHFSAMICGSGGIDVYSGAAFDVYQSVFGEGIFCGKGIISVDAYFSVLDSAFPEERVLSHDALEGERLRCAALTDVVLTDGVPATPASFFNRMHRWSRGDVQALSFIGKRVRDCAGTKQRNPVTALSRYKLCDNIRRLLVSVSSVLLILFSSGNTGVRAALAVTAAFSPILLRLLLTLPFAARNLPMRFFSHVLPSAGHLLANCAFDAAALFYTAQKSLDAVLRSLYRMTVSKKKLLEWTTAEDSELLSRDSFPFYFVEMFWSVAAGVLLFLLAPGAWHKITGLFWISMPFASYLLSGKQREGSGISRRNAARLREDLFDHWTFFSRYVTPEDNWLPPDNVSFRNGEKTAHRTSPTNIGLYMLSLLCVRDLGYISTPKLCHALEATLATVEQLDKWHGHLYNWYDTQTLEVIGGGFVSSVDSGNMTACLIALREGLKEYAGEYPCLIGYIARIGKLADDADYSAFYDADRELLSVGFDTAKNELVPSRYDIYMTECRTASYIGIARGQLPPTHWAALARYLVSRGGYMGMLSWNGTAFEYFMPSLFFPVYRNSLEFESLNFAAKLQSETRYGGLWGKSECGYCEIDADDNYKYRAVGISALGIERRLDEMKVVSPYSSFLCLSVAPRASAANLERLKKAGAYGKYGFYESVDFTRSKPCVTRSFMSHHVGMSIVAGTNALLGGVTPRRFMSSPEMRSCADLLKEKIPLDPRMTPVKRIYPSLAKEKRENFRF